MRRREFLGRLRSLGYEVAPSRDGGGYPFDAVLDMPRPGPGHSVAYTEHDLRVVRAWMEIRRLCGEVWRESDIDLHRAATYELAEHDDGWVVITEQTVNWTRHPTARVFDRGAVCIPVPSW